MTFFLVSLPLSGRQTQKILCLLSEKKVQNTTKRGESVPSSCSYQTTCMCGRNGVVSFCSRMPAPRIENPNLFGERQTQDTRDTKRYRPSVWPIRPEIQSPCHLPHILDRGLSVTAKSPPDVPMTLPLANFERVPESDRLHQEGSNNTTAPAAATRVNESTSSGLLKSLWLWQLSSIV